MAELGQSVLILPPAPLSPDMMLHRYIVFRVIWSYMLSIAVTYFITLCLFPGLESEIRNCTLGEWYPILIMAIFNLSDFVGKVGAHLPPGIGMSRILQMEKERRMKCLFFCLPCPV